MNILKGFIFGTLNLNHYLFAFGHLNTIKYFKYSNQTEMFTVGYISNSGHEQLHDFWD